MPNRSARKGKGFERELVQQAVSAGVPAYRCWGSDGRSRGHSKDVDLVLKDSIKLQTKRRSRLPSWLGFSENVDGVVLRQDHGKAVVVINFDWLLELLANHNTPPELIEKIQRFRQQESRPPGHPIEGKQ